MWGTICGFGGIARCRLLTTIQGLFQWVQQFQVRNPCKVFGIGCDQRQFIHNGCRRNDRIAEGHFALLAQICCFVEHGLRNRQNLSSVEKVYEILPVFGGQLMIPEHFYIADGRYGWTMFGNQLTQVVEFRLNGLDDDIAIEKHELFPARKRAIRTNLMLPS